MRTAVDCLTCLIWVAGSWALAPPAKRFEIEADLKAYPQDTPQKTLASVLKAVEDKQINYLLAQLADPKFVDARVKAHGSFEEFVREVRDHLAQDPSLVKQLKKFLKDGEWTVEDSQASAKLKDVKDRAIYLQKVGGRWFFEDRTTAKGKS
jgi:hypothetical protein